VIVQLYYWRIGTCCESLQQSLEEMPGRCTITPCLQEYINHFSVLVYCTPKVVLLAINLHKNFIDEECVAIALMFSL
jgi:hypothetical protein